MDFNLNFENILTGTEAIKYQDTDFKEALVKEFTTIFNAGVGRNFDSYTFMKNKITIQAIENIEAMTYERTGIEVKHYATTTTIYASLPYTVNENSSVAKDFRHKYSVMSKITPQVMACEQRQGDSKCVQKFIGENFTQSSDELTMLINEGKIVVDREKGRIDGLPEGRKLSLFVNFKYMIEKEVTPAMMAGFYMHEIGHMFTAIEYMTRTTTEITSITDKVRGSNGTITGAISILNKDTSKEADTADNIVDVSKVTKHYLDRKTEEISNLGFSNASNKDAEHQADNFSIMYGFGPELEQGLKVVQPDRTLLSLYGEFLAGQFTTYFITTILTLLTIPALWFVLMLFAFIVIALEYILDYILNTIHGAYDSYHDRVQRMKMEMIEAAKSNDLSKAEEKRLLNSIKEIELNTKPSKSKLDEVLDWMFYSSEDKTDNETVRKIEGLLNNRLHVKSLELKY